MSDDDYIIELAKKIVSTNESNYTKIFKDLSHYLETLLDGKDAMKAFQTIWRKNILPVMILEMKKNYRYVEPRSWADGFLLVHTVYDILTRIVPGNKKEETELHNHLIPEFIENFLCFFRQLQGNFYESVVPGYKGLLDSNELLKEIKKLVDLSESFVVRFPAYVSTIVKSAWFLQIFLTDNEETTILTTEWLIKLIKLKPAIIKEIGKSNIKGLGNCLSTIFDEIIFHIATSNNPKLIEVDINCLLVLIEGDNSIVSLLNSRYKGLKILILKWSMPQKEMSKHGFSSSFGYGLRSLLKYLESGSVLYTDASMNMWAIVKIQSWWRSVSVRLKLNKTNRAFTKFQKSYRTRKQKEKKEQNILRIRKELEHLISITRQRKFRDKLEAEVLLMETLPAPIVFKHLEKTRQDSATKIQSVWRGHRARFQMISRQQLYRKVKAVRIIQKYTRAWLSRKDLAETNMKLKEDPEQGFYYIPGMTVERKNELIKTHNKWMASHKHEFKGMSEDSQLELHHRAQQLYRQHLYGIKSSRRQDIERELCLARLETDSKLLMSSPSLTESMDVFKQTSDSNLKIDDFHCRIRPLANRAAQLHRNKINTVKMSWWKQLLIEEPPDLEADDDLLEEAGDLDQYMILRNRLDFLNETDAALM